MAFIFDMDGVVIGNTQLWEKEDRKFLTSLFGETILKKIGITRGKTIDTIYDEAVLLGFTMPKDAYHSLYDKHAISMYAHSQITEGIEILAQNLLSIGFVLGLVTSARKTWLDVVLPRITFKSNLSFILSMNEHLHLKSKPSGDMYKMAIKNLHATPQTTIILEDSNVGIQAAKEAHAYTIGFQAHIGKNYHQEGADAYAISTDAVFRLAKKFVQEIHATST